jgi:hypothetical protein
LKYSKIVGLAVLAAVAMTAFVGSGTAAGNAICKTNTTPCPEESMYKPNDVIEATAVNTVITALPEVTCTDAFTKVKVTKTGSATENVTGEVTAFSFSGCKVDVLFTPSCTVSSENLPYHAEVLGSGAGASLTLSKGPSGKEPSAMVTCAGIIACTFSSPDFNLALVGGNPGTVLANEEELKIAEGGFGCPEEGLFDADYKAIGANTSTFVVSE